MLRMLISGGQTGVDTYSLEIAEELGIPTGGTAAKGWMTEIGPNPEFLKRFGLVECEEPGYPPRTKKNVEDSDGTVIYGNIESSGSKLTIELCDELGKPCLKNPTPEQFATWLKTHNIEIANFAGNRASRLRGQERSDIRNSIRSALTITLKEQLCKKDQ